MQSNVRQDRLENRPPTVSSADWTAAQAAKGHEPGYHG